MHQKNNVKVFKPTSCLFSESSGRQPKRKEDYFNTLQKRCDGSRVRVSTGLPSPGVRTYKGRGVPGHGTTYQSDAGGTDPCETPCARVGSAGPSEGRGDDGRHPRRTDGVATKW